MIWKTLQGFWLLSCLVPLPVLRCLVCRANVGCAVGKGRQDNQPLPMERAAVARATKTTTNLPSVHSWLFFKMHDLWTCKSILYLVSLTLCKTLFRWKKRMVTGNKLYSLYAVSRYESIYKWWSLKHHCVLKRSALYESKPKPGGVGEMGVEASFLFFLHQLQQEPAEQRHCNVMSCGWS